jgi:hypothetical protein
MNKEQIAEQLRLAADIIEAGNLWPEPNDLEDSPPWIEWHGGSCPLNDEEVEVLEYKMIDEDKIFDDESCLESYPSRLRWSHANLLGDIIAYRVLKWRTPKTTMPLGPDDCPPGSVFRGAGEAKDPSNVGWCLITSCSTEGIRYWRNCDQPRCAKEYPWDELHKNGSEINRSIPLTGKWDATAWEPCSKKV